jgi:MFS family permease
MPVLVLLCTAQFMVVLDVTIVAVALPAIRRDLALDAASLQWIVTAYTIAFGGLLIPAGRAADALGRRRVLMAGLALFTGASLACGLAGSAALLIAARAVQGAGAAMVAPAALALLTAAFGDEPARGRALAAWTAAAAGGGAAGWVLGGVLADGPGWEWVFLANVPVGAAALAASRLLLADSRDVRPGPLDLPGGLALTATLALLVLGLARTDARAIAAAALAAAAFAAVERRAMRPLLPARLLRPGFATAGGSALALTAATSPAMLLAVLYQQEQLGRTALETGLGCAPLNLAVIAGSALGPRAVARAGERRAMAAGLSGIAAGAAGLAAAVLAHGGIGALLPAFVAMGAGLGCASVASTAAGTAAVGDEDQGIAGGVLNAAAQIGTAIGFAALVSAAAAAGTAAVGIAGAAGIALAAAGAVIAAPGPCGRPAAAEARP